MNGFDRLMYIAEAAMLSVFFLTMLILVLSPVIFLLLNRTSVSQAGRDRRAEDKRKKLKLVRGGKKK
jgi:multisubunit Na+/H+ antiporter MnhG subunit